MDIGRAVGLDAETVRARLLRLSTEGIIVGWDVAPNPSLLGRVVSRVAFPPAADAAERERIVAIVAAMDGARWIFEDIDGRVEVVIFHHPDALDPAVALLRAAAGDVETVASVPYPAATMTLDPADWRVVRALRRGPRRPYAEIAADAACSERTLRRRLDALTAGRALVLTPRTDVRRVRGGLPAVLRVVHPVPADAGRVAEIVRALPGLFRSQFEREESRASFLADGVGQVEEVRRAVREVPGVAHVAVRLVVRNHAVDTWLDTEIERRATDATAAARAGKTP